MKLQLPLKDIIVTQPFGATYLNDVFYAGLGLKGHNGIDFRCHVGTKVYAAHAGHVSFAGWDDKGGNMVTIYNQAEGYLTTCMHLSEISVVAGQDVIAGQLIALSGGTGSYTNGPHLHFGLKQTNEDGTTANKDNGYKGAIDPTLYFFANYQGKEFANKDCYQSNAYHRYFRTDRLPLWREAQLQAIMTAYLKRLPKTEELNAIIYGPWDREMVKNDALRETWAFETKGDYLLGKKTFQ